MIVGQAVRGRVALNASIAKSPIQTAGRTDPQNTAVIFDDVRDHRLIAVACGQSNVHRNYLPVALRWINAVESGVSSTPNDTVSVPKQFVYYLGPLIPDRVIRNKLWPRIRSGAIRRLTRSSRFG